MTWTDASLPMEQISTKGDLEITRLALTKEIEQVKSGIIKWVTGLLLVQTGVIVTTITLLR